MALTLWHNGFPPLGMVGSYVGGLWRKSPCAVAFHRIQLRRRVCQPGGCFGTFPRYPSVARRSGRTRPPSCAGRVPGHPSGGHRPTPLTPVGPRALRSAHSGCVRGQVASLPQKQQDFKHFVQVCQVAYLDPSWHTWLPFWQPPTVQVQRCGPVPLAHAFRHRFLHPTTRERKMRPYPKLECRCHIVSATGHWPAS